jgi:hypothetical protein
VLDIVGPFSLFEIVKPALMILIFSFLIALWVTRELNWSFFVACVKSGIFTLYYGVVFDGTFTFLDDWSYVEGGKYLVTHDVSSINFLAHLPELFSVAGGMHFSYYLFNADSFRIFGHAYYAPVSINVVLTVVMAGLITCAVRSSLGFSRSLSVALFVFLALQPNILAWSTIMNGKDTLVLMFTAASVYAVSRMENGHYLRAAAIFGVVSLVLFFTRFYLPIILFSALFVALLFSPKWRRNPALLTVVPAALIGVIVLFGFDGVLSAFGQLREKFVNPMYGTIRFLLTPIPFHTSESYSFLNVPQTFHWLMLLSLIFGIYRVWRKASLTARFIVIYFLGMILLYGMFEELQGPRHRYQLEGIIAFFQFYGSVGILRQLLSKSYGSRDLQSAQLSL